MEVERGGGEDVEEAKQPVPPHRSWLCLENAWNIWRPTQTISELYFIFFILMQCLFYCVADSAWFDLKTRQKGQINALDLWAASLQRPIIWTDVASCHHLFSFSLARVKDVSFECKTNNLWTNLAVFDLSTPFFPHYLNCLMEHSADHICVQHLYHVY